MDSIKSQKVAVASILVFQILLITLFCIFVKYDEFASPPSKPTNATDNPLWDHQYPMFQDVNLMLFFGFGFLAAFLKKYAFSAIGFTFFVTALVVQWGILCQGFFTFDSNHGHVSLSIANFINADIAAVAVLISFGAVMGRISPIQLFFMAILETALFSANEYVVVEILKVTDPGGSFIVHMFGAYFGLAVSFVLSRGVSAEGEQSDLLGASYQSDVYSIIGTLFLWIFWPSINGALLEGDENHRAVMNTYLALAASCLTVFALTALHNKEGKFEMVHVQNASLAGAVAVGSSCSLMILPFGALIIGTGAGTLCILGFWYIQDFVQKKMRVFDSCGVNNLHGMPGLLGGLIGALVTGFANKSTYGITLYEVFPGMGPPCKRSSWEQAAWQSAGVGMTLVVSIIGGLVAGILVKSIFPKLQPGEYFNDDIWWGSKEGEEK